MNKEEIVTEDFRQMEDRPVEGGGGAVIWVVGLVVAAVIVLSHLPW